MFFTRRRQPHNLYLNIFIEETETSLLDKVNACLLEYVAVADFRRLDSHDGTLQLTYFVACDDPKKLSLLVDELKATFPITEISFLQQEQVLGV